MWHLRPMGGHLSRVLAAMSGLVGNKDGIRWYTALQVGKYQGCRCHDCNFRAMQDALWQWWHHLEALTFRPEVFEDLKTSKVHLWMSRHVILFCV